MLGILLVCDGTEINDPVPEDEEYWLCLKQVAVTGMEAHGEEAPGHQDRSPGRHCVQIVLENEWEFDR